MTTASGASTATSPTQPDTSRPCASCSARPGASWPTTGRAGSTWATPTRSAARPPAACTPTSATAWPGGMPRAWAPRTCSACPGASRSPSRTTAGSCATPSCGTSRTPCPNRCATGSTAATNSCSCSSSPAITGSTWTPSAMPHATVRPQRPRGMPVTGRHPGDGKRGGTRPGAGRGRAVSRPPKYGPHTPRGRRCAALRHQPAQPRAPQWPQPG